MSESPASILLIDDHPLLRQGIKQLIDMEDDMSVAGEASNSADGIRLATELEPDLILMDIQLPEVSGLEVTKWIKEDDELKSIPVIAVTAFAMKGDEEKIREGGCEAYIAKPISVSSFLATVEKFLA
mgnify:CR=1 FL=1